MKIQTMVIVVLSTLLLFGCASAKKKTTKPNYVGVKKEVLIAAIGEPRYSIDTTFDDPDPSRTLVYPVTDPKQTCVESYKIDTRTSRVIAYACR